ncbi:NAD-dependent epimerase/dehydratase family protein [Paenibacillus sp. sgz500958]|uniref:NAD-dependent epimerase/dehydratase family protein n=1 Tax=Paenibacillus sp. sgz500958 TaxID=3242475 RepID=UPI0036D35247
MNIPHNKIKAIITGATGMVGEGVLHECLNHPEIEQILVVGRKPSGIKHPKLTEILHADFTDLSSIQDRLTGYNACFFCMGTSSAGMKEAAYHHMTYDLTMHVAELLSSQNPGMVFCYVSADGADSTEQGRSMWARVKGQTENALLKLPFRKVYLFRPGFIKPTRGLTRTHKFYYAINWLYPVIRPLFPGHVVTLREIGLAMIHSVYRGPDQPILGSREFADLARKMPRK